MATEESTQAQAGMNAHKPAEGWEQFQYPREDPMTSLSFFAALGFKGDESGEKQVQFWVKERKTRRLMYAGVFRTTFKKNRRT